MRRPPRRRRARGAEPQLLGAARPAALRRLAAAPRCRARPSARARVNAVYPSTHPLDEKIALLRAPLRRAGLADALPHHAVRRSRRASTPSSSAAATGASTRRRWSPRRSIRHASTRGDAPSRWSSPRGSTRWATCAARRPSIARRTSRASRACRSRCARWRSRRTGRVVATGLTIVEDDCAGLFDIITRRERRAAGPCARTVVAALLALRAGTWERATPTCRCKADNEPARRLYRAVRLRGALRLLVPRPAEEAGVNAMTTSPGWRAAWGARASGAGCASRPRSRAPAAGVAEAITRIPGSSDVVRSRVRHLLQPSQGRDARRLRRTRSRRTAR